MMQEVCDRKKAAALVQEAREIIAELKSETEEIAARMSRVLDGRDDDDEKRRGAPLTIAVPALEQVSGKRPSWQFWR